MGYTYLKGLLTKLLVLPVLIGVFVLPSVAIDLFEAGWV